jgi:BirA family biotin operon repressor/biotin-[acetyl-CoA-carboxylase] ligase
MEARQPTFVVQVVQETGSTNTDLLAAAAAGAPHGTVLRTLHQTAGRGRLDRTWEAPPGTNLLVSVLFRRGIDQPHRLTQAVAVAAATSIERVTGQYVDLKWPNDLLLGGVKLAGILAQAGGRDGRVEHVVVGLGLNVGWAPAGAARLGPDVDPAAILDELLVVLDGLLDERGEGHDAEYRRRLVTLGQRVRVSRPNDEVVGVAIDVRPDGRLVVRADGAGTDGPDLEIDTGDVVHLRPEAPPAS